MSITLAIFCHNFEHRFCWMLSSLLQQLPSEVELVVDAAYVEGTGSPTCKEVLNFFKSQGLTVKHTPFRQDQSDTYQKRGFVRNLQLASCTTDWIWFGDCDMAVRSDFLRAFGRILPTLSEDDQKRMLTCARYSTEKPCTSTDELIAGFSYPCIIQDAYETGKTIPNRKKSNIGAGYCQIANVQNLRKNHGGLYVPTENSPDNKWSRFWKTRSDASFRRKLGRVKVPLPPFLHFQHKRDKESGCHIEVQR